VRFVQFVIKIFKRQFTWQYLGSILNKITITLLWIYICFSVLWGLNYHRLGIASQLKLQEEAYSIQDLQNLTCDLIETMNKSREAIGDSSFRFPTNKIIFLQAFDSYAVISSKYQFLQAKHFSIKPSLLSYMVSYAGYSGYYNPFTGEAQLNTDLPAFLIPYTTCHEMGHQIGYASESEASFSGYLAATNSNNNLFKYSAAFDVFITANSELFQRDFRMAILNLKELSPVVRYDRSVYRQYITGKKNDMQPVISRVYDRYLKANQQVSGINSYDEIVGWIIAYNKKYGKL